MSLQQTRIVMIEKIEDYDRGSVNIILGHIDDMIYLAKVGSKNEAFLSEKHLENKWVKKILENNGYKICRSMTTKKYGYISWNLKQDELLK